MQWILDNWLVILLVVAMSAMRLFGLGHGKGSRKGNTRNPDDNGAKAPAPQAKRLITSQRATALRCNMVASSIPPLNTGSSSPALTHSRTALSHLTREA